MTGLSSYTVREKVRERPGVSFFRGFRNEDCVPVVLKVLSSDYPSPQEIARLKHEHAILRSLDSPGVVRTFGLEKSGNGLALVLEDVGERSLDGLVAGRRLDLQEFLRIAAAMAGVVESVHAGRVIHKDIKPQHFFLGSAGDADVKLIDFGLATRLSREAQAAMGVGHLEGKLAYMSPEQTGRMNRLVDRRSDLYSLGVSLYEVLTGVLPFRATDPLELVHSHIARLPRPPREVRSDVPEVLSRIVMKLLAKDSEERYQTAAGLRIDLELCRAELARGSGGVLFPLGQKDRSDELRLPQRLYGRESEVAELLASLARVQRGAAELLLVTGHSGIGKSALVNEIHARMPAGGHFAAGKLDQLAAYPRIHEQAAYADPTPCQPALAPSARPLGRSVPYAAVADACRQVMRAILTEPPGKLGAWKASIADAVAPNGRLLDELVPELELPIGGQPDVQELGPRESQHRFELVFQNFLQALATPEHPLVLFLDDLQWADAASLRLVHLALTDPRCRHLLLIGAYRDAEVDAGHPLTAALAELRAAGAPVRELRLAPLHLGHVTHLLADTLGTDHERVLPLAELLLAKTLGSPFFIGQFLLRLHEEKLLQFDARTGAWSWDVDRAAGALVTDNVVDFMIGRLRRLGAGTRGVLELAACIGQQFDVETLRLISEQSASEIAAALWEAIGEGLVLRLDPRPALAPANSNPGDPGDPRDDVGPIDDIDYELRTPFRFQHHRVQQAAYGLVDEARRREVHLGIGRLLMRRSGGDPQDDELFAVVNQMNLGAALITDPGERRTLARLGYRAGRKARDAAAHAAAADLLENSLALLAACPRVHEQAAYADPTPSQPTLAPAARPLGDPPFAADPDMAYAAYLAKAECESLIGNNAEALRIADLLAARPLGPVERMKVAELRAGVLTGLGRVEEAATSAVDAARLAGLDLPRDRAGIAAAVQADLPALRATLGARDIETLLDLPVMTDAEANAALGVLFKAMPAVIQSDPNLLVLITTRAVELSLRLGNSPFSSYYYVALGLAAGTITGDGALAYRLGQLGVALGERMGNRIVTGASSLVFGGFISPWTRPLAESVEHLRRGKKALLESGDYARLGYGASYEVTYRFLQGESLDEVVAGLEDAVALLARTGDTVNLRQLGLLRRTIADLRAHVASGGGAGTADPTGATGEPPAAAAAPTAGGNRYLACTGHIYRAITLYLRGDHDGAWAATEAAGATPILGSFFVAEQSFYGALALAGKLGACPRVHGQAAYADPTPCQPTLAPSARPLEPLRQAEERLRRWAQAGPANFGHRHALVAAELAALAGQPDQALDLYERAITLAGAAGAGFHQALASDLAGKFQRGRGRERLARAYQADARYAFQRWAAIPDGDGARAEISTRRTSTTSVQGGQLDALTVTRASQAISREIVLPRLVESLMRIVIEQAGAERGFLILLHDGEPWVEGVAGMGVPEQVRFQRFPLTRTGAGAEAPPLLPRSIVDYVQRTRKKILLARAEQYSLFADDGYFASRQPRSLLCLPMVRQGQVVGLLYLENGLIEGAFSPDRVDLLEVLASQAAISIENAALYERMEQRVQDRTRELEASLRVIQENQAQLVEAERRAAVAHYDSEMAIARQIQTSILPRRLEVPGLEIAAAMVTASEVGGDYYDLQPTDDGGFWLGIGDVSGHGLDSGLMMLMMQSGLAALMQRDPDGDPASLVCLLNRILHENIRVRLQREDFATLSVFRFHADGRFVVAGAHEEIVIWRARTGRCERIPTVGTWVGVLECAAQQTTNLENRLEDGDVMLLYTDGVTEARTAERELYGVGRLAETLADLAAAATTATAICGGVLERVKAWAPIQDDDQTLVVLRRRPGGAPQVL